MSASIAIGRVVYGPIVITASNDVLVFNDGTDDRDATLAVGTYYMRADGVTTSGVGDLLAQLQTALNSASGTTITDFVVTQSHTTGKVTISAGASFTLKWTDGGTQFDGAILGFDTSADDTGAATYTSDDQAQGVWYPGLYPIDEGDKPAKWRTRNVSVSGNVDVRTLAEWTERSVMWEGVPRSKVWESDAATNAAFQTLWDDAADGGSLFYYPDNASSTVARWVIGSPEWGDAISNAASIIDGTGDMYRVSLPLRSYVAP